MTDEEWAITRMSAGFQMKAGVRFVEQISERRSSGLRDVVQW